jgi:hypothetical protein
MACLNPHAGEAQRAVASLMMEAWGGPVVQAPEIEAVLVEAGFTPRTFPGPGWVSMVTGQR